MQKKYNQIWRKKMLKNRIIGKKIRNIVILLMTIIVMIGAYRYIDRSQAENVIEIGAIALEESGQLEEEIKLEAKQLEDGSYEIQLPEISNNKKINKIVKASLKNTLDDSTVYTNTEENILEIVENRIHLTKEQIKSQQLKLEIQYDIKEQEETKLYNKILKYEDKENGKLVEVKGYLPVDAELQVEEVTQEQLTEIFGDKKIKVAYDIKILQKVVTEVPGDEANPDAEPTQIVEMIEINPEEFGEICEVKITDASIAEKSKVYHVKEDNSYEQVNVTDGSEGNVSFKAQSFSVYAVGDDEIEPDPGEDTGAAIRPRIKYSVDGTTWTPPVQGTVWIENNSAVFPELIFTIPVGEHIEIITYSGEYAYTCIQDISSDTIPSLNDFIAVNGAGSGIACHQGGWHQIEQPIEYKWNSNIPGFELVNPVKIIGPTKESKIKIWGLFSGYGNATHSGWRLENNNNPTSNN